MDPCKDPLWIPLWTIWILYGPCMDPHMDPYMDPIWTPMHPIEILYMDHMDRMCFLHGSYMDPCKDPIWIPIWILYGSQYESFSFRPRRSKGV